MRWAKPIAGICASVALLSPVGTYAVPLHVYEEARSNPDKQRQIFKDGYATAVARTLVGLRSPTFPDGKQKIAPRIARDRSEADIVEAMVGHLTDEQAGALVVMIDQYATAKPYTELEDVITGFLLTEARKKVGQGQ